MIPCSGRGLTGCGTAGPPAGRRGRRCATSSAWVPSSTTRPSSMTTMRSALQDRGQAVGDDQGGAALHGLVQGALDQALVLGVQGAGGLVQQQDRRVADQGAGDGQALALAAGEGAAALAQRRVEALRQGVEEGLGLGRARRRRGPPPGARPRGRSGCSRAPSRRTAALPGPPGAMRARTSRRDRPRAGRRRPPARVPVCGS